MSMDEGNKELETVQLRSESYLEFNSNSSAAKNILDSTFESKQDEDISRPSSQVKESLQSLVHSFEQVLLSSSGATTSTSEILTSQPEKIIVVKNTSDKADDPPVEANTTSNGVQSNEALSSLKENFSEAQGKSSETPAVEVPQEVLKSEKEGPPVESQGESVPDLPKEVKSQGPEIQQESIKNALNEIINEIDKAVVESESDFGVEKSKVGNKQTDSSDQNESTKSLTNGLSSGSAEPLQNQNTQLQFWCSTVSSTPSGGPKSYEDRVEASTISSSWSSSNLPYFLTRPSRVMTPTPTIPEPSPDTTFPSVSSSTSLTNANESSTTIKTQSNDWSQTKEQTVMSTTDEKGKSEGLVPLAPAELEKIFTPAQDFDMDLTSGRRKMYGSSSFYSETHPTVEEQVELARKISHSLTDDTNQQSKGQSMYVKRKKKSVKWIHEGPEGTFTGGDEESSVEKGGDETRIPSISQDISTTKPLMKLVMNPRGQVQDWQTLKQTGMYNDHGALSPEICFDLVKDLHSPTGKGAQLFAKRRKKSEKWVVDETNVRRSATEFTSTNNNTQNLLYYNKPSPVTPKLSMPNMPSPSFIDRSRVEHAQKLNEIQERFSQPKLRLIKSPWEAALETGSVDAAFEELKPPPVLDTVLAAAERKMAHTPYSAATFGAPQWPPADIEPTSYKPTIPKSWDDYSYSGPQSQFSSDDVTMRSSTLERNTRAFQRSSIADFTNYNTAPRGFSHGQSVYRPIMFSNMS